MGWPKGRPSFFKGKSYEEIHGLKKAKLRKEKISKKMKGKGTYEEKYGIERANKIKEKYSKKTKGIKKGTYEEQFGIIKAKKIKKKLKNIKKNIKPIIPKWTKEVIKSKLELILKENGIILKRDIEDLSRQNRWICNLSGIEKRFGSLENLAEETGIKIYNTRHEDRNEHKWLNEIANNLGNNIVRQHPICNFKVDGYDPITNTVYEFDEQHHKYQKTEDLIRENIIKNKLNCNVIRMNDDIYVLQRSHKLLSEF